MASVRATISDQAAAAVEEVDARRGHDALVEVRAAAVVPDVVEADVERGNPEDLGPRELGLGDPDAGLRGGDDQRPGVGEPQRGGEVDREAKVGRLQRRGLQLQREITLAGRKGRSRRRVLFVRRCTRRGCGIGALEAPARAWSRLPGVDPGPAAARSRGSRAALSWAIRSAVDPGAAPARSRRLLATAAGARPAAGPRMARTRRPRAPTPAPCSRSKARQVVPS